MMVPLYGLSIKDVNVILYDNGILKNSLELICPY